MNRIIVVFLMLVSLCASMSAQRNKRYFAPKDMYMFGVCFSATDSTVYFTDIKQVPNSSVERGSGFLYSRNNYSYQLQQHIKSTSGSNFTTVTCYDQKRTKLEKKFSKMRQKYQKKHFVVNYIHDFAYKPITYNEQDEVDLPTEEAKKPEPPKKAPKGPRPDGKGGN